MVNKLDLISFIKKYYLDLNESVKWNSEGNNLIVSFQTPAKEVIGKVTGKGFPTFENDICIFDTKKLQSLVSICAGEILMEVETTHKIATTLKLRDSSYDLSYALADPLLIRKIGSVNVPSWDAKVELTPEDILNLHKAKSALAEADNMTISTKYIDNICKFVFSFGDEKGHNNKITYYVNAFEDSVVDIKIPFNANIFKSILAANKDVDTAMLYLNQQGLLKAEFTSEKIDSEYYMVRKAEEIF
jgi:hypothetical protein